MLFSSFYLQLINVLVGHSWYLQGNYVILQYMLFCCNNSCCDGLLMSHVHLVNNLFTAEDIDGVEALVVGILEDTVHVHDLGPVLTLTLVQVLIHALPGCYFALVFQTFFCCLMCNFWRLIKLYEIAGWGAAQGTKGDCCKCCKRGMDNHVMCQCCDPNFGRFFRIYAKCCRVF